MQDGDSSIEKIGNVATVQGLEFDYVGVIIGNDLRFDGRTGQIIYDKTKISLDARFSGIRLSDDATAAMLIKNTYRVLLTRGRKGCFVYCEDGSLSEYIKKLVSAAG